jgi:hypothetical protein
MLINKIYKQYKLNSTCNEVLKELQLRYVCIFSLQPHTVSFTGTNFRLRNYLDCTDTTTPVEEEEEPSTLSFRTPPLLLRLSGKMWVVPTFFVWVNCCKGEDWSVSTGCCVDPNLVWLYPSSLDELKQFGWEARKGERGNSELLDVTLLLFVDDDSRDEDENLRPVEEAYFGLSLTAHFLSCCSTLLISVILFVISVKKIRTEKSVLNIRFLHQF